jgi:histidine triad (HIT) family protein
MYDKNNIFAKILRKEIPCKAIYQDDKVLFFHDLYPQAKVHILGIPKIDVIDFGDFIKKANKETISHFFSKVYEVVKNVGLTQGGFKIISNSGQNAGQEVPHFHIHILGGEKILGIR